MIYSLLSDSSPPLSALMALRALQRDSKWTVMTGIGLKGKKDEMVGRETAQSLTCGASVILHHGEY